MALRLSEAISVPFPCHCICSSLPQNALLTYPTWKTPIHSSISYYNDTFLGSLQSLESPSVGMLRNFILSPKTATPCLVEISLYLLDHKYLLLFILQIFAMCLANEWRYNDEKKMVSFKSSIGHRQEANGKHMSNDKSQAVLRSQVPA